MNMKQVGNTTASIQPRRLMRGLGWAFALLLYLLPTVSRADTVWMGGMSYTEVEVLHVEAGQLVFFNTAGAEIKQPVGRIARIELDRYPQLKQAHQQAGDKAFRQAVRSLQSIKAQDSWLRAWINYRIVSYADQGDMAEEALRAYLLLIQQAEAPVFYFQRPPVNSLAKADNRFKKNLANRIQGALRSTSRQHPAYTYLQQLNALVEVAQTRASAQTHSEAMIAEKTASDPPTVAFTHRLDVSDEVSQYLIKGRFAQAVDAVQGKIQSRNGARRSPQMFYQLGLAQRGLADQARQAGDEDKARALYLDAGLNFMRIAAHYPQPKVGYIGPALLEAADIHVQIGHPDIATALFNEAAALLDARADAHLIKRLEQLKQQAAQMKK